MSNEPENELRFVPKDLEVYHYVNEFGKPEKDFYIATSPAAQGARRLAVANCFRTADQAQQVADLQKLMFRLAQIKFELEPNNKLTYGEYGIEFNHLHGEFQVAFSDMWEFLILFEYKENAARAANQLNKEGWRLFMDKHLEQWIKNEMGCVTGNAVLREIRDQEAIIEWLSQFVIVDDVGDYPNGDEPRALGFVVRGEALAEALGCVSSWDVTLEKRVREILSSNAEL